MEFTKQEIADSAKGLLKFISNTSLEKESLEFLGKYNEKYFQEIESKNYLSKGYVIVSCHDEGCRLDYFLINTGTPSIRINLAYLEKQSGIVIKCKNQIPDYISYGKEKWNRKQLKIIPSTLSSDIKNQLESLIELNY